jgi:hypothetical protein
MSAEPSRSHSQSKVLIHELSMIFFQQRKNYDIIYQNNAGSYRSLEHISHNNHRYSLIYNYTFHLFYYKSHHRRSCNNCTLYTFFPQQNTHYRTDHIWALYILAYMCTCLSPCGNLPWLNHPSYNCTLFKKNISLLLKI